MAIAAVSASGLLVLIAFTKVDIDFVNRQVTLHVTEGRYHRKGILYISMDAAEDGGAGLRREAPRRLDLARVHGARGPHIPEEKPSFSATSP